jgi:hypothetical protein
MALCCAFLDDLVSNIGKRGFSVLLKSEMGFTFFCLQARAVDAAEAERLGKGTHPDRAGLPEKIRLSEQVALSYCPSCGCKLEKWIADHPREAEALIDRSRALIM